MDKILTSLGKVWGGGESQILGLMSKICINCIFPGGSKTFKLRRFVSKAMTSDYGCAGHAQGYRSLPSYDWQGFQHCTKGEWAHCPATSTNWVQSDSFRLGVGERNWGGRAPSEMGTECRETLLDLMLRIRMKLYRFRT